ncbi:MAG TPA: roadblock/LC7 domain-containing protein [Desulfuromonadaceae bacterium]|jgi:predicted regulator of Ras-like GTPase activity (Roadblock/LC7/MglB family)
MSLKDTLREIITKVEGGLAAIIMAYDGIPIDEITIDQSEFDLQLLTVEYATVLKEIKRASEVIKVGEIEEVSIVTARLHIILRVLTDELFVVLVMTKDSNFGKGRYLLRLKSFELAQELG